MLHRFESFEPRRIEEREPQAKLLRKKQEKAEKIVHYVRNQKNGITHADFIVNIGAHITPEKTFLRELYYMITGLTPDNKVGFEVRDQYSYIEAMIYDQQSNILHISSFFADKFKVKNVKEFIKEMFKKHLNLKVSKVKFFNEE